MDLTQNPSAPHCFSAGKDFSALQLPSQFGGGSKFHLAPLLKSAHWCELIVQCGAEPQMLFGVEHAHSAQPGGGGSARPCHSRVPSGQLSTSMSKPSYNEAGPSHPSGIFGAQELLGQTARSASTPASSHGLSLHQSGGL